MDMGFTIDARGLAHDPEQPFGAPDWRALRDRLGAQWLARRALSLPAGGEEPPSGSFNSPAVFALAAYAGCIESVNPTALGNGKPNQAIGDISANAQPTGGRG